MKKEASQMLSHHARAWFTHKMSTKKIENRDDLAFKKTIQNTQEVKNSRFLNMD